MPWQTLLWILAVAVAGVATLAVLGARQEAAIGWPFLALTLTGTLAGAVSVRVPERQAHLAPTEPFLLAGLALVGPLAAMIVAGSAVLGREFVKRSRVEQFSFNMGSALCAGASASLVFDLLGGQVGMAPHRLLLPVVGAALAFSGVNAGLLAGVMATMKRQSWMAAFSGALSAARPALIASPMLSLAIMAIMGAKLGWLVALAVGTGLVSRWLLRAEVTRFEQTSGTAGLVGVAIEG